MWSEISSNNQTDIRQYRKLSSDISSIAPNSYQRQYLKRKFAGQCTATGCVESPARGHTRCRTHLNTLSQRHKQRYGSRKRKGRCVYCGERPQFWGVRCVICRQKFSKALLPLSARKAIHSYFEAERKREIELRQAEARFQARKLLLIDRLTPAQAQALQLFLGDDSHACASNDEIARLMGISKQRVYQLLLPLKKVWEPLLDETLTQSIRPDPERCNDTRKQKIYRRRRAKGLCGYGQCAKQAAPGHSKCEQHSRKIVDRAKQRCEELKQQKLCTTCGKLPQFWGVLCIMCRSERRLNPLPSAALRALRIYRTTEASRESGRHYTQLCNATVRFLAKGEVKGKPAEALRLYVGLDQNRSRSYREVGEVMELSGERVRQLLMGPLELLAARYASQVLPMFTRKRCKPINRFAATNVALLPTTQQPGTRPGSRAG